MDVLSIDQSFEQAIQEKIFSGAQVIFGKGQQALFSACYGTHAFGAKEPKVETTSIFDVASLTKPVVTAMLCQQAVQVGKISLQDPIKKFLSHFTRPEKMTIEHLLSHRSGLPAWLPLFEEVKNQSLSKTAVEENFLEKINAIPLAAKVGAQRIYSDLGFILLGFILEKVAGSPLDQQFQDNIAKPVGMTHSSFNPLNYGVAAEKIVATEACPWRGKTLRGEVHDDNAYVLGGVAGHAGLFSTALDLEKFIHHLFRTSNFEFRTSSPLGLAWDTVSRPHSQAGQYFSDQSVGHLAFTGCSLWIDALDQKYVILLTNSVHPHREEQAIKAFRPKVHDLLMEQFSP